MISYQHEPAPQPLTCSESSVFPAQTRRSVAPSEVRSTSHLAGIAGLAADVGDRPIYVVLDFDGVLHSVTAGPRTSEVGSGSLDLTTLNARIGEWAFDEDYPEPAPGKLFDRAWLLGDLLARLPTARVLISTSWRNSLDLTELKRILPAAIADRVDDALPRNDDKVRGTRERLSIEWLETRGLEDANWIALDDDPHHYSTTSPRLVRTSAAGLTDADIDRAINCLGQQLWAARACSAVCNSASGAPAGGGVARPTAQVF